MKIIVENDTKIVKYLLDENIEVTSTHIVVGNPARFIIADLNSSNATVIDNINDAPNDWKGCKYLFDNGWLANPNWKEPVE